MEYTSQFIDILISLITSFVIRSIFSHLNITISSTWQLVIYCLISFSVWCSPLNIIIIIVVMNIKLELAIHTFSQSVLTFFFSTTTHNQYQ